MDCQNIGSRNKRLAASEKEEEINKKMVLFLSFFHHNVLSTVEVLLPFRRKRSIQVILKDKCNVEDVFAFLF